MRKTVYSFIAVLLALVLAALASGAAGNIPSYVFNDIAPRSIRLIEGGEKSLVSEFDYIRGAAAAYLKPDTPAEAIKAFAVILRTNLSRREPSDPRGSLRYLSENECREKWGAALEVLHEAVEATQGICLTYDREPILAAFHELSPGKLTSGEAAFGAPYEYLSPSDCPSDLSESDLVAQAAFSEEELLKAAARLGAGGKLSLSVDEALANGYVASCTFCSMRVTGAQLATELGLASPSFTFGKDGDKYIFTTRGIGHGAGLSLRASRRMAERGMSFESILSCFYPGCTLTDPVLTH